MSDNDFIILDEEEKKDPKGDGAEKEENHELTASGHEDKEDNDNENEYEKICFICHRPESVTGRMIDLPNNITVCPDCMQRSFDAMTSGAVDLNRLMNMPGVQFVNMSDLENMQPKQQKIKKKKEKPKEFHQLDVKNIPAPIRSKPGWMSMW